MMETSWQYIRVGFFLLLAVLVVVIFFGTRSPSPDQKPNVTSLPPLGLDINQTTVSGISSGAYMAGQFHLAHNSIVTGAGLIAGGPYGCAQSVFSGVAPGAGAIILSASRAVNGCMLNALKIWGVPNPARLAKKARALARQQRIDPIENITSDRIYLFSGSKDQTVKPPIVEAAKAFYIDIGIKPQNIRFKNDIPAGHGFVTTDHGGACASSNRPFIVDCDYDQAGAVLNHLIGNLAPPAIKKTGTFLKFDQIEFAPKGRTHYLSKTGIVYIPKSCRSSKGCRVHVAYHGCSQNIAAVGDAFSRDTGYARWADNNRIIILFPQVSTGPLNPTGCWDWWGYTGKDYLTRSAPQIQAVRAMLERLSAPPAARNSTGS